MMERTHLTLDRSTWDSMSESARDSVQRYHIVHFAEEGTPLVEEQPTEGWLVFPPVVDDILWKNGYQPPNPWAR